MYKCMWWSRQLGFAGPKTGTMDKVQVWFYFDSMTGVADDLPTLSYLTATRTILQCTFSPDACHMVRQRSLPALDPLNAILAIFKCSHLYLLVQITKKRRKIKLIPFKCHCHHGEFAFTIQRIPHPQKGHHQISTADLPTNKQSNFSGMFNTQYLKHHIFILP